jgi:hypothetical protein
MRPALLLIALSATSAWAQTPADGKTEAARATESLPIARKAAESYSIALKRSRGRIELELHPEPLLQWSNPIGGSFHGSVFIWTEDGHPEVIASIYRKYVPTPPHLGVEFHSLTGAIVSAERDGQPEWFPAAGLAAPTPVPGAPTPADSPAHRLRQLREMAREFTATKTDRKGVTRPLRLLTQPLYRYESPGHGVVDGALFTFVEGTDPEVFLLIEAIRGEGEKAAAWRYALARMNSVNFRASHKDREVWSVPTITWQQAFNPPRAVYAAHLPAGTGGQPSGRVTALIRS